MFEHLLKKELSKQKDVMRLILEEKPLLPKHRDHSLSGNWASFRECHIDPDWLLIYRVDGETVFFERTGSHTNMF